MRSLFSAWGFVVYNVSKAAGTTCRQLSTKAVDNLVQYVAAGDNRLFSTDLTDSSPRRFTQAETTFTHLLPRYFSPLSTAPITTNVKKGFRNS